MLATPPRANIAVAAAIARAAAVLVTAVGMRPKRTTEEGLTAEAKVKRENGKDQSAASDVERPQTPCSAPQLDGGGYLVVGVQCHEDNEEERQEVPLQEEADSGAHNAEKDDDYHSRQREDGGRGGGEEGRGCRGEEQEKSSLLRGERKMRPKVCMGKQKAMKYIEHFHLVQQPSRQWKQHQQSKNCLSDEKDLPSALKEREDEGRPKSATWLKTLRFSFLPSSATFYSPSSLPCVSAPPKKASYADLSVSPASSPCSLYRSDSSYAPHSPHYDFSPSSSLSTGSAQSTPLVSYPSSCCSPLFPAAPSSAASSAACPTSSSPTSCSSCTPDSLQTCLRGQRLRVVLSPSRTPPVTAGPAPPESPCAGGRAPSSSSAFPSSSCSPSPFPQPATSSLSLASVAAALFLYLCRCRNRQWKTAATARFFGAVCTWYAASLLLTALNKYLFDVLGLPLPVSATFLHFSFVSIALQILVCFFPHVLPSPVPHIQAAALTILPAAACAAADVALTNSSYNLLPISAITLVKSSSVFFTYLLSVLCRLEAFRMETLATLIFIMVSICLTVPEMEMKNPIGIVVVSIAVFVGALRWIFIQRTLRQHRNLSVPHLLLLLQPLSSICLSPVVIFYEVPSLLSEKVPDGGVAVSSAECQQFLVATLIAGGSVLTAALVLFAEVSVLEQTSSVSLCVTGVGKEVLTISMSVVVFGEILPARVLIGIVASIIGVLYYAYIRYKVTCEGLQRE